MDGGRKAVFVGTGGKRGVAAAWLSCLTWLVDTPGVCRSYRCGVLFGSLFLLSVVQEECFFRVCTMYVVLEAFGLSRVDNLVLFSDGAKSTSGQSLHGLK